MDRKISIIIPVYNSERHIHKTIDSVISQKFDNWELILVNDGSTDKSGLICNNYAKIDSRIKVFHQKNRGVSAARNFALSKVTGDRITFIDSDDWIETDYLSNFMEFPYTDNQIVYQGYYMDYEGDLSKKSTKEVPEPNKILHLGAILGKCFATKIITDNAIRFDERLCLHEDHVFYYECLKHTQRFDYSVHAGYHYMHYGEQSLSRKLQSSTSYFLASKLLLDYYEHDTTTVDTEYKRSCIQKFGLNQIVMGIFSLYFEKLTCKQRILILKEKQSLIDLFRQYYVPNSLNGKLFLFCYLHLSPLSQDLFFNLATTILGTSLKSRLNLR